MNKRDPWAVAGLVVGVLGLLATLVGLLFVGGSGSADVFVLVVGGLLALGGIGMWIGMRRRAIAGWWRRAADARIGATIEEYRQWMGLPTVSYPASGVTRYVWPNGSERWFVSDHARYMRLMETRQVPHDRTFRQSPPDLGIPRTARARKKAMKKHVTMPNA